MEGGTHSGNKIIMSDIRVQISLNPKKESVLINPNIRPMQNAPMSKELYDQQGVKDEVNNILAVGTNRKEALRKHYGGF